jgi:phosphoribosylformimino-5-aminoimidazole carboxamide ribotide isomerase
MIVIPAIDLLGGQAVRLHQGRYDEVTVYDADPPSRARAWRGRVPRLHVVDLEGAKAGRAVQIDRVKAIVAEFGGGVQIGGGVRSREAFESYLALGVERVVLGTAAVRDPEMVRALARDYPGTVILAVDAKEGMVATDGWTSVSQISAIDLARSFADLPIAAVLYTDVARDGTRIGPNVEMTAKLARDTGLSVIASGGVGTLDHLRDLAKHPGIDAAIVGRAIYDGSITLDAAISAARSG